MKLIDQRYTDKPFLGYPRMTDWLNECGYLVNPKRVARLMRKMGLQAIGPKPKSKGTSRVQRPKQKHPYLLKGLTVDRPNQVWASDITYIPMNKGWLYLVAIIDWYSRYVLSWELSNTLDTSFCLTALQRALQRTAPEIFNTDQGSQFTSEAFTQKLMEAKIAISWASVGRCFDNIFVERLWRTVKYEEVYLCEYDSVPYAWRRLYDYFHFYNTERRHSSLGKKTPQQTYLQLCQQ